MKNKTFLWMSLRVVAISALLSQSLFGSFLFQADGVDSWSAVVKDWWGLVAAQVPPIVPVAPTVQTTIDVYNDGAAPFDNNTYPPVDLADTVLDDPTDCSGDTRDDSPLWNAANDEAPGTNEWKDSCEKNGIVRVWDSIIYDVEMSINDANATNAYVEVNLDPWNTGYPLQEWVDIPSECRTTWVSPVSSINWSILLCNVWDVREWTKIRILPAARTTQFNPNDWIVAADVCWYADGSDSTFPWSCDTPVETITTAWFGYELFKSLPGNDDFIPFAALGEWGEAGQVVTFLLDLKYETWSEALASVWWTRDFQLIDIFWDDNPNNNLGIDVNHNASIGDRSNGVLYDRGWTIPCSLTDANGASIACVQNNNTLTVDVTNVDVYKNPLFQAEVKIWLPDSDIVSDPNRNYNLHNHVEFGIQDELTSTSWVLWVDNDATVYDGNNDVETAMVLLSPGTWSPLKTFWWEPTRPTRTYYKNPSPGLFSPWDLVPTGLYSWFTGSNPDSVTNIVCDNIDTDVFEYAWSMLPYSYNVFRPRNDGISTKYNPGTRISWGSWLGADSFRDPNELSWWKIEYSDIAVSSNTTAGSTHLEMLRDSTCEDDMNGDGVYDWTTDISTLWGDQNVTKVRLYRERDAEEFATNYPSATQQQLFYKFYLKLKPTVGLTHYNADGILPNYANSMYDGVWTDTSGLSVDPNDYVSSDLETFSFWFDDGTRINYSHADRLRVVPATIAIQKDTVPSWKKISNIWEVTTFSLKPQANGTYGSTIDLTLRDRIPIEMSYVQWSDVIIPPSVPNGTVVGPVVTNVTATYTELHWYITWVTVGQPIAEFHYDAVIDQPSIDNLYTNDIYLFSDISSINADTESSQIIKSYTLEVISTSGFDVEKSVPQELHPLDTPFTYELNYWNFWPEDFAPGQFIDVLPYTANDWRSGQAAGDGGLGNGVCDTTQVPTSWPTSCRVEPSDFQGTYQLTNLTTTNGETNCYVTDADPALIDMFDVPNHGPNGTLHTWTPVACNGDPSATLTDISAFYFETTAYPTGEVRRSLEIELTPTGNAADDIYTNSFGWEIPDIDLQVISNDVFVTMVSFDLALTKVINTDLTPGPYFPGDSVVFDIEVENQGSYDADGIEIVDYAPAGMSFDATSAINMLQPNGWESTGSAHATLVEALGVGESTTIQVELTIDEDAIPGTLTNFAEIASGYPVDENGDEITSGIGLVDGDSTPDTDNTNDAGWASGTDSDNATSWDGSGIPGDVLAETDEDDHDPAEVIVADPVHDLALSKTLVDESPYKPGDAVTFDIEIFNQGENFDASNIVITEYIPAGLMLDDAAWTDNGDGTATMMYTGTIPKSDGTTVSSDTVQVTFTIMPSAIGDLVNRAEITQAEDTEGNIMGDIDSTPDSTNFNTDWETNDLGDDNVIDEDGLNSGDEDDHDPALVTIDPAYDLALTKEVTTPGPNVAVYPGDDVTFTITVLNQGNSTATEVEVTDYIPTGLALNDVNWTDNGDGTATYSSIASIAAGAQETVTITFQVDQYFSGEAINWAEISSFLADDGSAVSDEDSTPNADQFSEPGETDDTNDDDVVDEDGNSGGDEDDHDFAAVMWEVYDLALVKSLPDGAPAAYPIGSDIEFVITITNQGTVDATATEVIDYIPAGLDLNDANWTDNGDGTASYTTAVGPLAPGTSQDITITLNNNWTETGMVTNWAEIAADDASETYGTSDADSTPDSDNFNSPGETDDLDDDGENTQDGFDDGDEDDHDPETVQLDFFDLALAKTVASTGPFFPGSEVIFNIEVTNQGSVVSNDFTITDYIPAGLSLNDTNWTSVSDTVATYMFDGALAPDTTETIQITMMVDEYVLGSLTNWAEISEDDGDVLWGDIDSTPDADNTDPYTTDDAIDGVGGDEDDHDPAEIMIDPYYDLALIETLNTTTVVEPGDVAKFDIEVFNQGNILAEGVEVTTYIPEGLVLDDVNWVDNGDGTATYVGLGPIAPGASAMIQIMLKVEEFINDLVGDVIVWSEISADNGAIYGGDVDSMPDSDNFNTPGETNDLDDDNVANEDGKNGANEDQDEDDHDPELLLIWNVYDLALTKMLSSEGPFFPGSEATFAIQVMNQGNMPASDIEVTDYLPEEFTLVDTAWTDNGDGSATYAIPGTIAAWMSETIQITVEINQHILGDVVNWAEISNDDGDDVDSTADADEGNDGYDDTDDVTNNANSDEDDHDPATLTVEPYPDLALIKTLAQENALAREGDEVVFEIEVINQGNIDAIDIEITDYIPAGLVLNDAAWTDNGDDTAMTTTSVDAGESVVLTITFEVDFSNGGEGEYVINIAEISDDKAAIYGGDIDSTPDADSANDNQPTLPSDATNDEITNMNGDEDDHDLAALTLIGENSNWGGNAVRPRPEPVFESAPEEEEVEVSEAVVEEEVEPTVVEIVEVIEEIFVPSVEEIKIIEVIQEQIAEDKALSLGTHSSAEILDLELPTFLPQTGVRIK